MSRRDPRITLAQIRDAAEKALDHRVLWDAVHIDIPRLIEAIDELLG